MISSFVQQLLWEFAPSLDLPLVSQLVKPSKVLVRMELFFKEQLLNRHFLLCVIQIAALLFIYILKNKVMYLRKIVYGGYDKDDFSGDRKSTTPRPEYLTYVHSFRIWSFLERVCWLLNLLKSAFLALLKFTPYFGVVTECVGWFLGSTVKGLSWNFGLPLLGDLSIVNNGLSYIFALSDYATLPTSLFDINYTVL